MGDLLEPGPWQDEAAADWVFHLPPHAVDGPRVTRRRAASITRARVLMDAHLLDAVAAGATRRIVYVADTSCYGATGPRPITEDTPPQPSAWGRCLTPALERLDGYIVAGQPIVAAFPGWVYGNGGWFRERVIEPVMAGRRVLLFGKTGPWMSPIHVEDCARALVHLAEHGEPGGRYFLVNRDPIRLHEFAETFARLANRPLRVLASARGGHPTRGRSGSRRPPPGRCRVLEHPTARDRLPLPVSHARPGTPASPRSAR